MQAATLTATPTSKPTATATATANETSCLLPRKGWPLECDCLLLCVCGVRPVRGVRPRRKASGVGHSRKMRRSGAGRRSVNWLKASPTASCGLNPLDVESF